MEAFDPAAEWLQLSERYRQMSDSELMALARQISELTDAAQQILTSEMSRRGVKPQPEEPTAPPIPTRPLDPSYDEDRKLIEILTVWSLSDALQLQTLLDAAGIPFFMGAEKATSVDTVTSSFVNGVSMQIMQVGVPWARQVLMNYAPANDPAPKPGEELRDLSVRCPKCHSTDIVLERLLSEPTTAASDSQEYEWTCDSCGHHWEDDGIVEEE